MLSQLTRRSVKRQPCTCAGVRATSSPAYPYPIPSTSSSTLDAPSFEALLPPRTTQPLPRPSKKPHTPRSQRLARRFDPLPTDTPTSLRVPRDPPPHPSSISPYLPLVTRERNFLLSTLRHILYDSESDPNEVWEHLVRLLQYPSVLPDLPLSWYPSSERATEEDGTIMDDLRRPIQLSLFELREVFTRLSHAKPRTRTGLSRLLVVVELLAMRAIKNLPPISMEVSNGGRDQEIGELRGGGAGLREKDFRALIQFAAGSYRAPRPIPDISSATSLFSQWSRLNRRGKGQPKVTTRMYNVLLDAGGKSRSWELVEGITERMESEGVEGDMYTLCIRLKNEERRGEGIDRIWATFEEGYERLRRRKEMDYNQDTTNLWNTVVWIIAKRGFLDDALKIYSSMRNRDVVDFKHLAPSSYPPGTIDVLSHIVLPSPDIVTYSSLIQAFAYRADLQRALQIMQDMVIPLDARPTRVDSPSIQIFTYLFRGFASHGETPDETTSIDPLLLSGQRVGSNATARVDALASIRTMGHPSDEDSRPTLPWNYSTLQSLTSAFLSLPPPTTSRHLPFAGQRTAPSSKQLFWLILAFEKMSGGDSRIVLDVWERIVEAFDMEEGIPRRWRGFHVDKRLEGRVEIHRKNVELMEEQEGGGEDRN